MPIGEGAFGDQKNADGMAVAMARRLSISRRRLSMLAVGTRCARHAKSSATDKWVAFATVWEQTFRTNWTLDLLASSGWLILGVGAAWETVHLAGKPAPETLVELR